MKVCGGWKREPRAPTSPAHNLSFRSYLMLTLLPEAAGPKHTCKQRLWLEPVTDPSLLGRNDRSHQKNHCVRLHDAVKK